MNAINDDPLIGRQLANFKIERPLGRGGMAVVYYGRDVKLDRPVAIKVIDARHRHNTAYAQRFVQEAQAVAKWRHEHIIHVYYADDEDGLYYFVMEYIDGLDLGQVMTEQEGPLPHDQVLHIGEAVASALDYAHEKGVIHRDIKPSNVMIAKDGRVILTDFGLALDVEQGSIGETLGSPHYVAPEQARRSADAVPQSDLYSLGVILYEMLTGQVPFNDPSATSIALQHLTKPPPPPRTLNPDLNPATELVLLKALSKEPGERYKNGRELMKALTRALKGKGGQDELLGQQLDEYRLDVFLGHGGMGRIYRAHDVRLKRNVALKVIDAARRADDEYRARFEREAQAIAQLEHQHIVSVYRYGEVSGVFYIAMQYIEGLDLRTQLARYRQEGKWVPYDDVSRIMQQICSALDYAHSRGIIHRDVKPSNIMIDEAGSAYLTDFGLVLAIDTQTQGEVFGSPRYIAPEQAISSAGVTPQSDLYAMGVILYEMLTGQLPFDAPDPLNVAMMHMSESPPPPRDVRPELNGAVEGVVLRALAKEPEQRYADGKALVAALEEALHPVTEPVASEMRLSPSRSDISTTNDDTSAFRRAQKRASSEPKRPLPPVPAAVVIEEAQEAAPPPVTSLQDEAKRRRRGRSLGRLLILILVLGGLVAAIAFWPGGFPLEIPGMAAVTPSPTAEPPTTAATDMPTTLPTMTSLPPATEAAAVSVDASATPEPTETATPPPTETATLPPTETTAAAAVPLETPSSTPTPLLTETPAPTTTPSPTPFLVLTREQDEMPMVVIPATTFVMGPQEAAEVVEADELPAHEVTLDSFAIDQHEVTVAQYAAFLDTLDPVEGFASYVNNCNGFSCLSTAAETVNSYLVGLLNGGYVAQEGFENYPINNVSWHGADAYCRWAGARLPSEAEWELAASGGDGRLYPWGDTPPEATQAVFATNFAGLQPVDALPDGVSAFGLYGMAGGVWEWVADGYEAEYYASSPAENPTGPTASIFAERVVRGGAYNSPAIDLRVTNRRAVLGTEIRTIPDVGFRCAQTVAE